MVSEAVMERCEAGAVWLDANYPGWEGRITLASLDLGNCVHCVLGQTCGHFFDVYKAPMTSLRKDYWDWTAAHGFSTLGDDTYGELTTIWKALILARKATDVARKRALAPITEGELVTA